ncbi:ATP-dependent DNA ligase [Planctomicrobium piriforme]|uniref:DNA ligase (ATP) n=1 Tax=Planctomicrobium piriforme TaxID=1576369 RepID=A0A1I3LD42_9PLAN|nr:ATP-dependent DNA ligase [Planctomicrobium piriforme]SFI82315.1 DNA ligase-1 [Planctomicrobium piriforme]
MQRFTALYTQLDETTKTNRKIAAMRDYFSGVDPADGAWAVYFLCGQKLKRLVLARNLRAWCAQTARIPDWLFDESYDAVGDLAETIALLLPSSQTSTDLPLHHWIESVLLPLAKLDESSQRERLMAAWPQLSTQSCYVLNKLVTGSFRVGVSQKLVVRALADAGNLPTATIAHRLMGSWQPTPEFFKQLLSPDAGETDISRPYPFCLAHALQADLSTLGNVRDWQVEWKWDGIRAQLIRRQGETFLWSRGEEMILDRFPELIEPARQLPDGTVLDGEVVGWRNDRVLPFADLQKRIGRKTVGKKLLADVPARLICFDLLEEGGIDLRERPLEERMARMQHVLQSPQFAERIVPADRLGQSFSDWPEVETLRTDSRELGVEGLMLKHRTSPYGIGRVTGLWWKWKVDPYNCDAVLVYAQRGHGRRASLYTDYTFAAWDDGQLVPFAKAYSGLTDAEIREVDRFVRKNTLEKFGPVRSVKPELVFELAFENIQASNRHKSGIAVRFPRIALWRKDKKPADADSLETLRGLLRSRQP